jgi:hypothetical protein
MPVNRISRLRWRESTSEPAAVAAPQSFVVCPGLVAAGFASPGWTWQNELFRIAYENAQANRAALSRSSYDDRLFSNWN